MDGTEQPGNDLSLTAYIKQNTGFSISDLVERGEISRSTLDSWWKTGKRKRILIMIAGIRYQNGDRLPQSEIVVDGIRYKAIE